MNDAKLSCPHYVAPLHPFLRWLKTVAFVSICVAIGVYAATYDEGPRGVAITGSGNARSWVVPLPSNIPAWTSTTTIGSISGIPPACPIDAFSSSPSSWLGSARWSPAVPCLILFPGEPSNPSCVVSATDSPIPLSYKVMADALEIDAQGHGFDVACTWSTK